MKFFPRGFLKKFSSRTGMRFSFLFFSLRIKILKKFHFKKIQFENSKNDKFFGVFQSLNKHFIAPFSWFIYLLVYLAQINPKSFSYYFIYCFIYLFIGSFSTLLFVRRLIFIFGYRAWIVKKFLKNIRESFFGPTSQKNFIVFGPEKTENFPKSPFVPCLPDGNISTPFLLI